MTLISAWTHGAAAGHPAARNKYWGAPAARAVLRPRIHCGPNCVSDGHPPDCIRPIHLSRGADLAIAAGDAEAEHDLLAQAVVLRHVVIANPYHDEVCWLLDGYTYDRMEAEQRHLLPDLREPEGPVPPVTLDERLQGACWGALVAEAQGADGLRDGASCSDSSALLRILPVAVQSAACSDEERAERIRGVLTGSASPLTGWCCQFLAVLMVELLQGEDVYRAYGRALNRTSELLPADGIGALRRILDASCLGARAAADHGGLPAIRTLETALWCLHRHRTYASTVQAARERGAEGATCGVVGTLAGLREGIAAIPRAWRSTLPGTIVLSSLIDLGATTLVAPWRRS